MIEDGRSRIAIVPSESTETTRREDGELLQQENVLRG